MSHSPHGGVTHVTGQRGELQTSRKAGRALRSDHYTYLRTGEGWLYRGPAKFAPMTVAMLGKNGDQLERLARTAADILVLQHCHEITPAVISSLRAHASDYRNPRRYLIIDGYDTLKILASSDRR